MYKIYFKRGIDIIIAIFILLIILPVLVIITIWLFFVNKGSGVFFYQERPGMGGRIFKVIKFKSMTDERDVNGNLLPNEKRITSFGQFIRKTSIDELPQLFNVVKGEMSLIGPRPLRVEYLPLYNDVQRRRHDVRPGITGWAQVNGRNALSWEEKFELDVWYVKNICFLLDLKILFQTIKKVFLKENINKKNGDTMTPFKGIKLKG